MSTQHNFAWDNAVPLVIVTAILVVCGLIDQLGPLFRLMP